MLKFVLITLLAMNRVSSSVIQGVSSNKIDISGLHNQPDVSRCLIQLRSHESSKKIYLITPTYMRPGQLSFLTSLSQTLMIVGNMHWLVIEDADVATPNITELLKKTGLEFEHLTAPTLKEHKITAVSNEYREVVAINRGLDWLRNNAKDGVFYITLENLHYSVELFNEIRKTKKLSMFPVGFGSKWGLNSPVLRNGEFEGYYDGVFSQKYRTAFPGFAVNIKFLLSRPNAKVPISERENGFITSLEPFDMKEVDFLADQCTKILVWKSSAARELVHADQYCGTNIEELAKQL